MPKIHEEVIVVKISKLVKNQSEPQQLVNQDLMEALVSVVEELTADASIVVEVEKA